MANTLSKIYVDSKIIVTQKAFASMCFNNNKVISKSKYAIDNHTLTLLEDTKDNVSIYYNNGIANTYEFETRLYKDEVILPTIDRFGNVVYDLNKDNLLVFLDGELEPIENYEIVNGNQLKFIKKHTNDASKIYKVFVYASDVEFSRETYTRTPNSVIDLPLDQYNDRVIVTPYYVSKTLIFVDGIKVPFNCIEERKSNTVYENNTNESKVYDTIKLNIPETLDEISSIEVINFIAKTDDTTALHFITRQGYLTYGPYDSFNNKIPNKYDTIIKFTDQTKLLIDNLRTGFMICEEGSTGKLIVTDENFEKMELKCLTVYPFLYSTYNSDQYYFEVPETTNIIKYLSEYDKKYTFLPEILTIYQRLLLDEVQDTITRLRNARSISKVDSVSINKLIQFLGFNLNIKTLSKKQRRELLEEIDEFYRIAGTRNSYNLVNILQNNLKLINIEQLFTIYDKHEEIDKKTIWYYEPPKDQSGEYLPYIQALGTDGYDSNVEIYMRTNSTPIIHGVVRTTNNGNIDTTFNRNLGFLPSTTEGYDYIDGTFELVSELEGYANVLSAPVYYNYNHSLSGTSGFEVNDKVKTLDGKFNITVTQVDSTNGQITNYNITPTNGSQNVSLSAVQLYLNNNDSTRYVEISTKRAKETIDLNDTTNYPLRYSFYNGGQTFDIVLDPGEYIVVMSGGGGAGAASDSVIGSYNDTYAEDGKSGQLVTTAFKLTSRERVFGIVGQGGGKVFAKGHDGWKSTTKGAGYENGKMGSKLTGHITTTSHHHSWGHYYTSTHYHRYYSTGGQGGGSSAIYTYNKVLAQAAGGNGGSAYYEGNNVGCPGGLGGFGGTSNGSGAAGGIRNQNNGTFWSTDGNDGWIRIYNVRQVYTHRLTDTSELVNNDQFKTINLNTEFTITCHTDEYGKIYTTMSPTVGYYTYNGTYVLNKQGRDITGTLSVTSTPTRWLYKTELKGLDTAYLKVGQSFINSDDDISKQFVFTITEVNDDTYKYSATPVQATGNTEITVTNSIAKHKVGSGTTIKVTSKDQDVQNENDRCYVDFYTKKELGADLKKEYRINKTDYGLINEGTPSSPEWWEVGYPDIDYGQINEGTPLSPDTAIPGEPDENYGNIIDKVKGEWVEWWEWDRNPNYYPTNHVALEMKMPIDVDFSEYVNTFVEQIYNLASTVLYIQTVIESFYFGKDTTDATNPKENLGAPFGIATGAPIIYETITVTSNPAIQYQELTTAILKVHPMIWTVATRTNPDGTIQMYDKLIEANDANVTLTYTGQTTPVTGTGVQQIQVPLNTEVTWTISKDGTTVTGSKVLTRYTEKYIPII